MLYCLTYSSILVFHSGTCIKHYAYYFVLLWWFCSTDMYLLCMHYYMYLLCMHYYMYLLCMHYYMYLLCMHYYMYLLCMHLFCWLIAYSSFFPMIRYAFSYIYVCVCVCVCVYTYYIYIHTYTHTHIYSHLCTYIYICIMYLLKTYCIVNMNAIKKTFSKTHVKPRSGKTRLHVFFLNIAYMIINKTFYKHINK